MKKIDKNSKKKKEIKKKSSWNMLAYITTGVTVEHWQVFNVPDDQSCLFVNKR